MFEWSDEHQMVREAIRQFIEKEIKPNLEELEHGDTPPYDVLRKLYKTFGLDAMAADGFDRQIAAEKASGGADGERAKPAQRGGGMGGGGAAMPMIPIIEVCRYCPGMVPAMGVTVG